MIGETTNEELNTDLKTQTEREREREREIGGERERERERQREREGERERERERREREKEKEPHKFAAAILWCSYCNCKSWRPNQVDNRGHLPSSTKHKTLRTYRTYRTYIQVNVKIACNSLQIQHPTSRNPHRSWASPILRTPPGTSKGPSSVQLPLLYGAWHQHKA